MTAYKMFHVEQIKPDKLEARLNEKFNDNWLVGSVFFDSSKTVFHVIFHNQTPPANASPIVAPPRLV